MSKRTKIQTSQGPVSIKIEDIPQEILRYGFEFEVDASKVWALDAPTVKFPFAPLEWLLNLTPWDYAGKALVIGPRQVLAEPERYRDHYLRIVEADLHYPIDISYNNGRWIIIDGLHRLSKIYLSGMEGNDLLDVRIHSKEDIVACMDMKCTPQDVVKRYRYGMPSKTGIQKRLGKRPKVLKSLREPIVFDASRHLELRPPENVVSLTDIGYTEEFMDEQACGIAYTAPFQIFSEEGIQALRLVVDNLNKQDEKVEGQSLLEYGAAAYLSPFMESFGKDKTLSNFLSAVANTQILPYVRQHYLAALNVGKVSGKKEVRPWHNDYQSLNLIVFIDDPKIHRGGDLLLYKGTKEEADSLLKASSGLPEEKSLVVEYPKAGYAVLIQGSLLKHKVTPLKPGDPDRHTLVIGYRGGDLRKNTVEYNGVAPDHPMCKYPEAAKQAASIVARRLTQFVEMEMYSDNPRVVLELLEASMKEVTAIAQSLKTAPIPEKAEKKHRRSNQSMIARI